LREKIEIMENIIRSNR